MIKLLLAILIFTTSYILIAIEKLPSSSIAILGSSLMVLCGIIDGDEFINAVDWEVILLLIGMMVMVNVLADTGLFEYIAIKLAKFVRGRPVPLLILLSIVTAVLSAFLDNVTTILVLVPVSILLAKQLDISPIPFVISEIISSNIGGAATLIGDPPNIIIAANADYTFNQFLFHMAPIAIINLAIFIFIMWVLFRNKMKVSRYKRGLVMDMDPNRTIKDGELLFRCLIVFGFVILGFLLQRTLQLTPAVTALCGATIMVTIAKKDLECALKKIEWNTIFFFGGLFVLVHSLNKVGILDFFAKNLLTMTKGNLTTTSFSLLWISSLISSFLDNVPYTATIAPMIKDTLIPTISELNPSIPINIISYSLWWALSLGACLGGNGTLIGASANIVGANILEKSGNKMSFLTFTKYGAIVTLFTTIASTFYLWFRYLPH